MQMPARRSEQRARALARVNSALGAPAIRRVVHVGFCARPTANHPRANHEKRVRAKQKRIVSARRSAISLNKQTGHVCVCVCLGDSPSKQVERM